MKKFSSITSQKVNEEPKVELSKEDLEINLMKAGIMKLMDNLLTIRSYGSARAELLNGALAISGKEMFVEALMDMMGKYGTENSVSALESLKSTNRDWESIDNKIYEINNNDTNIFNENLNQIKKIKSFLNTYHNDERFVEMLETYSLRVSDGEEAYIRAVVASKMIGDKKFNYSNMRLSQLSDKFYQRAKELGYRDAAND